MVSAQTITSEMFSQKASTSLQTLMCHGLIARLCNCTLSVSGLIKLASTTAAWVVTSGQDQGIAKLVDEKHSNSRGYRTIWFHWNLRTERDPQQ